MSLLSLSEVGMGPQIVFVCVSAYQAGWLQTHAAREALESRGAVALGDGSNRWQFPNGVDAQFTAITVNVVDVLRSVEPRAEVVLLYEGDDADADSSWYIESILENLVRERDVRITHFRELLPEIQAQWSLRGIEAPEYDLFDTIPNLPTTHG